MTTEKILQFVLKSLYGECADRMSRILYLKLNTQYLSLYAELK